MLNSYIYIIIELLLLFFIVNYLLAKTKEAPYKIKQIGIILLLLMITRISALIILFLFENIIFIYIFRYIVFLNIMIIPVSALISLYIFYRSEKVKFDYLRIISGIVIITYTLYIYNFDYSIKRLIGYNYSIVLERWIPAIAPFIIIMSMLLIFSIASLGRKVANNTGIILMILATSISIGEVLLGIMGITMLPNMVISDAIWMIVFYYAVRSLK